MHATVVFEVSLIIAINVTSNWLWGCLIGGKGVDSSIYNWFKI